MSASEIDKGDELYWLGRGLEAADSSIGTMHLAKGLEFRAIAVMACDDEIIPSQERIENVADDADLEEVYDSERHLDRPKRRIASGSVFSSSLLHPKNRRSRGIVGKKIPLTFTKDGDDAHRAISKLKLIARRQDGRLYQGAPAARYRIFPRQVKS